LDTRHYLVMINDIVKMTRNMYDQHCKSMDTRIHKSEIPFDTARVRRHWHCIARMNLMVDGPDQ
jgi:hypothetical protein